MTLSSPSFLAALTRASIPPRSSADLAEAALLEPEPLSLSFSGGEHAATPATASEAARVSAGRRCARLTEERIPRGRMAVMLRNLAHAGGPEGDVKATIFSLEGG